MSPSAVARTALLPLAALALCLRPAAAAPTGLEDLPAATAALAAHRDGLAGVAVQRLDAVLAGGELDSAAATAARKLLVENLVRDQRYERALRTGEIAGMPFWNGVALAGLGKNAEALTVLGDCISDPDCAHREQAALTAASIASAAGDLETADRIFEELLANGSERYAKIALAAAELKLKGGGHRAAQRLLPPTDASSSSAAKAAVEVLRAEADLLAGDPGQALAGLENVLASADSLPMPLVTRATFLLCDTREALGDRAAATALLTSFAEASAAPEAVQQAADRLAKNGTFDTPEGKRLLEAWTGSSNPALAMAAKFHLANIAIADGRYAEAEALLRPIAASAAPVSLRAKLLLVRLHMSDDDTAKTEAEIARLKRSTADPSARARIQFVEARAEYLAGEFVSAAGSFTGAGDSPETARESAYNAALAALRAGDEKEFEARLALLPEVSGDESRSALALERALLLSSHARQLSDVAETTEERDSANAAYQRASASLTEFLRDHPKHERAPEALLAQAEISLIAYYPPRSQPARDAVAAAKTFDLPPGFPEKLAYLEFWIEEVDGEDPDLAVTLADAYLAEDAWAASPRAPEVRMRQAEIHFRNGDYLDARLKFEQLVADYGDSEYADQALFFAGRAALLTRTDEGAQKAILLWQQLVERGGPLALPARRHQAQIRLRKGNPKQAIELIDAITGASPPPSPALRISSLMIKGEAQAVLASKGEIDASAATSTFQEAREIEGASSAAIHESMFREGQVHAANGDTDKALDLYHSVVYGAAERLSEGEAPEFFWFYRAGFVSIGLLKKSGDEQKIDAAIAFAVKMANTPGPRAADAHRLAEQLKREHFRWD